MEDTSLEQSNQLKQIVAIYLNEPPRLESLASDTLMHKTSFVCNHSFGKEEGLGRDNLKTEL